MNREPSKTASEHETCLLASLIGILAPATMLLTAYWGFVDQLYNAGGAHLQCAAGGLLGTADSGLAVDTIPIPGDGGGVACASWRRQVVTWPASGMIVIAISSFVISAMSGTQAATYRERGLATQATTEPRQPAFGAMAPAWTGIEVSTDTGEALWVTAEAAAGRSARARPACLQLLIVVELTGTVRVSAASGRPRDVVSQPPSGAVGLNTVRSRPTKRPNRDQSSPDADL